jgi:RHS repeat-associated protein
VKGGASGISTNLNGSLPFASAADPDKATTDNIPRAYLNIMFFDERFNFVPENSTAVRVSQSGSGAAPLVLPANVKAPKNGYAYIYVSNENDQAVYFDNLQVVHNRGRIIEEDHYYAFGLKIAGISSNKLGNDTYEGYLQNKNLYNDKELIDEGDFNWYDYGFRNYDAQIGRFPQLDPLTDDYPELTPFQYGSNDPIANIDLDGLEGTVIIGGVSHGIVGPGGGFLGGIGNAIRGAASSISSLGLSIGVNAARIGTEVFNGAVEARNIRIQTGEKILEDVFRQIKPTMGVGAKVGGTILAVFWPSDALKGGDLRPEQYLLKYKPNSSPNPTENPTDEDDDFASVRFQVQQGSQNHIADDVQVNIAQNGVTKKQGYSALGKIYSNAIKKDPSLADNKEFKSAIIRASAKIKSITGGISRGINYTTLQEKFQHNGRTYRIDIEVLRGNNFKY